MKVERKLNQVSTPRDSGFFDCQDEPEDDNYIREEEKKPLSD